MTQQFESLIDLKQLDKNLINKAFKSQNSLDIYMAFDDSIDTLMVMFTDPQDVDTATYHLSDRLACVVDIDSLQIVGFWLMRFSKFWIEMEEFEEIKEIWDGIIEQGILSSFQKVQKKRHNIAKGAKKKDWGENGKSEKVIKELFESKELKEALCLA
jgi:hypothetical protein